MAPDIATHRQHRSPRRRDASTVSVLVVGMHRSGTSAFTEALVALGLDPGHDPLVAATEDNPTGLFEVGRLTGLDDDVLDAVGGRWSAPADADPAAVADVARTDLGDRARELMAEVFSGSGWVWKDPRLSLLLPFWRETITPEPAALVVVRHPLEVARSLEARDGIALEYGLALWERYTRTMLRDLEGMVSFVVDYDEVMDDTESVLMRLVDFLGDQVIPLDPDAVSTAAAHFGDHRHQQVTEEEFGAETAATDELRALYRQVQDLHGSHTPFPPVDLGPETPRLQMAFAEHKRLSRFEERVNALESEIARRDSQITDLRVELQARSEHASEVVDALVAERAALTGRLEELESWWPVATALRIRRVLRRLFRRG